MKIVILNECFLSCTHIAQLEELGEVSVYKDTDSRDKLLSRVVGADIVLADMFSAPWDKETLANVKGLKLVNVNSTGFNLIDLEAANKSGVKVANTPGFGTEAVAEHTIALMFSVAKKITQANNQMRTSSLEVDPGNPDHMVYKSKQLAGKTLGILGLGAIGSEVAKLAKGIGMKVVAYNRSPKNIEGIPLLSLEELLSTSDVVSINLALTKKTEHIIGEKELGLMKQDAILINTARGKHIDEEALLIALSKGKFWGVGLDVFESQSNVVKFAKFSNVIMTPHSAWLTDESVVKLADIMVGNVKSFVEGKPKNIVN